MKKLLLLPLLFAIAMQYSCNKDEIETVKSESSNTLQEGNLQTVPLSESVAFLKDFQKNQLTKKNTSFKLTIDFETLEQIDITDTDAKLTIIKAQTGLENIDSSILQIIINGELQTVLFNLIPEQSSNNKKTNKAIEKYEAFSGDVVITNLQGVVLNNFIYQSGQLVGEVNLSSTDPIPLDNVNIPPKPKPSDIIRPYILPGYQFRGEGGPNNYSSMGIAFANYYSNLIYATMEKNILDKDLTPCQKAVLEKLKGTKNYDIASMLKKLGVTTPYTVNIVGGNLNTPAQTVRTKNGGNIVPNNYTIVISNDYTSRTSLSLAGNILHEIAHAYFLSLYDKAAAGGGLTTFVDYPILFQAYVQKNFPNNGVYVNNVYVDQQDLHHQQMAETYVNAIASTLQEFQTGTIPTANIPLKQEYLDLAWGGLYETPIFDKTFPKGSEDRNRILNRLLSEQSGSDTQSNGGSRQYPLGSKCEDYIKK